MHCQAVLSFSISLAFFFGCTQSAPTEQTCPGGYRDGEKVEKGAAWFECRNGQLQAKGCSTTNGDRLKLEDTFDADMIRSVCRLDSSGAPSLVPTTCVQDNREHPVGESWDDSKYVFTCEKDSQDRIQPRISGCIREGKKVTTGEKLALNGVVYECKQGSLAPFLSPWGCMAEDGTQHAAGESFDLGPYWYTCSKDPSGVVSLDLGGCVNQGKRFKDGDHFFKDDLVFECQSKDNGANLKVAGCMQQDPRSGVKIERRVGCTWTEGETPYLVTMTCVPDQQAKTAVQTVVRCNYKMPGGTIYNVEIGCYRLFENAAVGCVKNSGTGKVVAQSLSLNAKGEVQSVPSGLKFC